MSEEADRAAKALLSDKERLDCITAAIIEIVQEIKQGSQGRLSGLEAITHMLALDAAARDFFTPKQ